MFVRGQDLQRRFLYFFAFVFNFHSRALNFVLQPDASFQMIVSFFCLFFIQYFYLMHFFSLFELCATALLEVLISYIILIYFADHEEYG